MAKREPYIEETINNLKVAIFEKTRPKLSDNFSKSLRDLVDYCLNIDPDKRPKID